MSSILDKNTNHIVQSTGYLVMSSSSSTPSSALFTTNYPSTTAALPEDWSSHFPNEKAAFPSTDGAYVEVSDSRSLINSSVRLCLLSSTKILITLPCLSPLGTWQSRCRRLHQVRYPPRIARAPPWLFRKTGLHVFLMKRLPCQAQKILERTRRSVIIVL